MVYAGESSKSAKKIAKKQHEAAIAAAIRDSHASLRITEENIPAPQENVNVLPTNRKGKSKAVGDREDVGKAGKRARKQQADIAAVSRTLNASLRISEENFDDSTPCSEENVTTPSSECQPNRRGKSKALDDKKNVGPYEVSFNHRGQPVGRYAAKFATFLGVTARNLVPLTVPDWRTLSIEFKNQIWEHIVEHYIVEKCYKKQIFQRLATRWTDHKSKTLKKFKQEVPLKGFDTAASDSLPSNVHSLAAWKKFLKSKMTPEALEKSKKFQNLRGKRKLLHKTSRKSMAQVEYELKEQSSEPDSIGRSDVWLEAYGSKNKDDTEDVEDEDIVQEVRRLRLHEAPASVTEDAVAKVLGPERRGRVRGLGFGALPSKVDGQAHTSSKYSKLEQEVHELKLSLQRILSKWEKEDENTGNDNIPLSSGEHSNNKNKNAHVGSANNVSVCGKKRKEAGNKGAGSHQEANQVPSIKKLHLLSWLDADKKVVAAADLHSKDPKEMVHCVPVGHGMWKVWVRNVYHDIPLIRPTSEFNMLSEAVGSTVAWPVNFIEEL